MIIEYENGYEITIGIDRVVVGRDLFVNDKLRLKEAKGGISWSAFISKAAPSIPSDYRLDQYKKLKKLCDNGIIPHYQHQHLVPLSQYYGTMFTNVALEWNFNNLLLNYMDYEELAKFFKIQFIK